MANPTVNSITMSNTALAIGQTSNVTITFSEAVLGFSNSDVTAQNGTLSTLTSTDGGITWTAVFTPNSGVNSSSDFIIVGPNYTDASSDPGSTGIGPNYTIDTVAPNVDSIVMSNTALDIGDTSNVTITFSEAVNLSNSDVTAQNGTLSTVTSSDGGVTWTAVLTPNTGVESMSDVITVANYTDLAGNTGVTAEGPNYTIDTVAPTVSSIVMSDTNMGIGETSNVTITFSKAVTGFSNSDVTVQNGTLGTLTSSDGGIVWTAVFTPTANTYAATNAITVGSSYTDLDGNQGVSATSSNYIVDTITPTVSSIVMSDTALNIGSTSNVTITFSEPVTGFSNSDVTAQNGTLSTLTSTDGGTTWTAVFTPTANVQSSTDVITVGPTYTDLAGNPGSTTATSGNYTIDTVAPSVTSITLSDTDLKVGETSNLTIVFSEAVNLTNSDVTAQNGTLSTLTSTDGGVTWTAVFTPNTNVESATDVITVANYTDLAGNTGASATSANYTIDTQAPSVSSIVMSDTALNIGSTSNVTITFSKPVTGFSNSDVTTPNGTLSTLASTDGGVTWTAVLTPNSGVQSNTDVITVGANYTDLDGNAGSSATSANYTVDTVAPSVSSIVMSDTHLNIGSTSNVTITFSEAVTGFSNSDVTVQNGTLSTLTSSDNITWRAVFTPNSGVQSNTDVITVGPNYTDSAGNQGSSATSANYTVDTVAPSVSSIVMSDTALLAGTTSNVTITFSEAVTGFSNSDVTAQNGTLSTLTSTDGGVTWTAVFTPSSNVQSSTDVLTVGSNYTDLAGNQGTGATSANYTIDTVTPSVSSIVMSDTALTAGTTSNVTITFSEAVTGFSNSDVTVQNGTLSTLTSSDGGVTWTAVFTPNVNVQSNTDVVTVGPNYTSLSGNPGTSATGPNYTINTVAPSVSSIVMSDTALNIGATSTVTITFSDAVTGFSNSDVTAQNGTLSTLTSSDNITWTAVFTPNSGVQSNTDVITVGPNYTDSSGNQGTSATGPNYTVDTVSPTVQSIVMSDTALNNVSTSNVTITFSEAVTGFSNSDVTAQNGTLSTLTSSDGGLIWTGVFTPTANIKSATDVITVGPNYTDLAGNPGSGAIGPNYTVDTVAPTVSSITLSNTALNMGSTSNVTMTFSEAVNLTSGDVSAQNGMVVNLASSNGGTTWTGLLIPSCNVDSLDDVITVANYTDSVGNVGPSATSGNYTVDTLAPYVSSLAMSNPYLTTGSVSTLTIAFSEPVTNFNNSDVTVQHGTLSTLTSHNGGAVWTATFVPTRFVNDALNTITIEPTYTDLAGNTGTGLSVSSYIVDTIPS